VKKLSEIKKKEKEEGEKEKKEKGEDFIASSAIYPRN